MVRCFFLRGQAQKTAHGICTQGIMNKGMQNIRTINCMLQTYTATEVVPSSEVTNQWKSTKFLSKRKSILQIVNVPKSYVSRSSPEGHSLPWSPPSSDASGSILPFVSTCRITVVHPLSRHPAGSTRSITRWCRGVVVDKKSLLRKNKETSTNKIRFWSVLRNNIYNLKTTTQFHPTLANLMAPSLFLVEI